MATKNNFNGFIEALKNWNDSTKGMNQATGTAAATPTARSSDLLDQFAQDAQKAARTYETYTDEANTELVATNMAQLRADYLPKAQQFAGSQFDADRARVRTAVGVDYDSATAMQAAQMKWAQVEQLLEHGQPWETIIEQAADTHTLAAIVEHAPTWLGTGKTGERSVTVEGTEVTLPGHNLPLADIDLLAARRAAELGSASARAYVEARAQHAYNVSVGEDIAKHLHQQRDSDNMAYWADMYAHKAETLAARVKGEPTPNERIEAERKAQAQADFQAAVEHSKDAASESPDQLAARIPRRGY
jgi:nucleotide-binding universal stress UspA family protein